MNDITQHSTSSFIGARYDEVRTYKVKYVEDLEAESARRLAMLKDASHMMLNKGCCSHCFPVMDDSGFWSHADDCELNTECNG